MTTTAPPTTVLVSLGKFDAYNPPRAAGLGIEPLRLVREGVDLADFKPLTLADYSPRGGTPLRDAVARFISHLDTVQNAHEGAVVVGLLADESGSMGGNERSVINGINEFVGGMADVDSVDGAAAGKVLCVIVTDGLENSSTETSPEQLAAIIAEREQRGWTFIYMGANQDAWATGQAAGFSGSASGQAVNYVPTAGGTAAAFRSVAQDASSFLADNKGYGELRARSAKRSIGEDGDESLANAGASPAAYAAGKPGSGTSHTPPPAPAKERVTFDPSDALRQARGDK